MVLHMKWQITYDISKDTLTSKCIQWGKRKLQKPCWSFDVQNTRVHICVPCDYMQEF